jgi:hypothetical protein
MIFKSNRFEQTTGFELNWKPKNKKKDEGLHFNENGRLMKVLNYLKGYFYTYCVITIGNTIFVQRARFLFPNLN